MVGGTVVGDVVVVDVVEEEVVVEDVVVEDVVVEDVVVEDVVGGTVVEDVVVVDVVVEVVVEGTVVGGGMGCEQRIACDTSRPLVGVYDCPGIGFGNSWLSVPDFNTRSVQMDPAGGGGTVNDAVSTSSILMPVSHQNSTWLESMARAEPVTTNANNNPATRAVTMTTDLVTLRRKCIALRPSLTCRSDPSIWIMVALSRPPPTRLAAPHECGTCRTIPGPSDSALVTSCRTREH